MFEAIGSPMFWTLCLLVFVLAIALIFTIAYLFVYLGYFTAIDVKVEKPEISGLLYAYKEFDDQFDEVPKLYKSIAEDYPENKTLGLFESYDESYTEGVFKLGALISDKEEVKTGYLLGTLPDFSAAICSSFEIKDPIQISVGYKRCRAKMLSYAKEHDLKTDTFLEIYSPDNSSYYFLQ